MIPKTTLSRSTRASTSSWRKNGRSEVIPLRQRQHVEQTQHRKEQHPGLTQPAAQQDRRYGAQDQDQSGGDGVIDHNTPRRA